MASVGGVATFLFWASLSSTASALVLRTQLPPSAHAGDHQPRVPAVLWTNSSAVEAAIEVTQDELYLKKRRGEAVQFSEGFSDAAWQLLSVAHLMRSFVEPLKQAFDHVGDAAMVGNLGQAAAFAQELEENVKQADLLAVDLDKLVARVDPQDQHVRKTLAENITDTMEKAAKSADELGARQKQALSVVDGTGNLSSFSPIMHFVDEAFAGVPSTCGGKLGAQPMVANFAGCAAACEADGPARAGKSCVGLQYVPTGETGLCFLFSQISSVTYYPGCSKQQMKQKQMKEAEQCRASETTCVANTRHFEGNVLTPDRSGKFKDCLQTAKKADLCFDGAFVLQN
jgi:hypothetical protein